MKPSRSCASRKTVLAGRPSATLVMTNCGGAGGGPAAAKPASAMNGNAAISGSAEKRYMYPSAADTAMGRALPQPLEIVDLVASALALPFDLALPFKGRVGWGWCSGAVIPAEAGIHFDLLFGWLREDRLTSVCGSSTIHGRRLLSFACPKESNQRKRHPRIRAARGASGSRRTDGFGQEAIHGLSAKSARSIAPPACGARGFSVRPSPRLRGDPGKRERKRKHWLEWVVPSPRLPLRLVFLAALAIGAALVLGLVVATLNSVLEFYQRLSELPIWLRVPLIALGAALLVAVGWLIWRLARPATRTAGTTAPPVSRSEVETRIDHLRARKAETAALEAELVELDRRRASGDVHVALFGEISTGKSSLIRALAQDAAPDVDVRGGTTRAVAHFRGRLPDGRALVLADVPGSAEVEGRLREQIARDEALRAHAVVYVTASDLTRAQDAEIAWLAGFGKPLVIAVNKADQYDDAEIGALVGKIDERYDDRAAAVVAISA